MSIDMNGTFGSEARMVNRLFSEDLDLSLAGVSMTYATFSVDSIDKEDVPAKLVEVDFYNERVYLDSKSREGYAGKLDVYVWDVGSTRRYGCDRSWHKPMSDIEFNHVMNGHKLSLLDCIANAR